MNDNWYEVMDSKIVSNECYIHYRNARYDGDLSLIQFGHHETPALYGFGPMMRNHYLIHFVKRGRGRLVIHDSEYELQGGQAFLIYPYQIAYYEAYAEEPWEYYWIGFTGLMAERLMQEAGFSYESNVVPMYYQGDVFDVMDMLISTVSGHNNRLLREGLMQIVLYHMTREAPEGASKILPPIVRTGQINKQSEEYVRIITSIIQTSFRERINVEEIANQLGLNRSYLTELFKKYTGQSIKQYLTSYRISMSLKYLRDQNQAVKDVAYKVGFQDPLYFSRLFKRYEGCSPQEYRDRMGVL